MSGTALVRDPASEFPRRSLLIMIGVMGVFALLPVQLLQLPLQMDIVDFWTCGVLFVFMLGFLSGYQTLRINIFYTLAMWLILVASTVSTFAAVDRVGSLIVVLKEVYLFAAFATVATLLAQLNKRDFRMVMLVWLGTVVLHGMLIVAEFLIPDLFRFISRLASQTADYEIYRPSGLFFAPKAGNANKAAVFQLLGFVPLVLTGLRQRTAITLGLVLLSSILATGSMGTTAALVAGFMVALMALAAFGKHLVLITKFFVRSMFAMAVVGGFLYFLISNHQGYHNHFDRIFLGRAEKSSGGRFSLWERGVGALNDPHVLLCGVGAENFRDVDVLEKQLHNDLLAFTVERGVLGALGLVMLVGVAVIRSVYLLEMSCRPSPNSSLASVAFVGAFAAVLVVSLTHQVFHSREIWLVLAVQEAIIAQRTCNLAAAAQADRLVQRRECWGLT